MKAKLLVVLAAVIVVGSLFAIFNNLTTELRTQRAEITELRAEVVSLQGRADAMEMEIWRDWVTNTFWDIQELEDGEDKQLPSLYVHIVRTDSTAIVRRCCAKMARILESVIEKADPKIAPHLEAQVKEYNRLATMIGG